MMMIMNTIVFLWCLLAIAIITFVLAKIMDDMDQEEDIEDITEKLANRITE